MRFDASVQHEGVFGLIQIDYFPAEKGGLDLPYYLATLILPSMYAQNYKGYGARGSNRYLAVQGLYLDIAQMCSVNEFNDKPYRD